MSQLGQALANLTITVVSWDGWVQVASRGGRHPMMTFVDSDAYFDCDSRSLKDQIEAALTDHASELRSARRSAVRDYSKLRTDGAPHWNAEVRRAQEKQLNITSFGTSIGEFVEIESVGLRDWTVMFSANALTELSPGEFLREVNSALLDTYQCHAEKLHELKQAQSV